MFVIALIVLVASSAGLPTSSIETTPSSTSTTTTISPPTPPPDFRSDCADPHNSQVKCTVHEAVCDGTHSVSDVVSGQEPPEAHDLRVDTYTKILGKEAKHKLHVDISWQMPPSNDSYRLRAFLLEIVPDSPDEEKDEMCFLFNVTDYSWTGNSSSPRFHFSTDSLFEFSHDYFIRVKSLPRSKDHQPLSTKRVTMHRNPGANAHGFNTTDTCRTQANTQAAKWTAGFRKIFLNSMTRTIQIQFVAAPPSICFEAYEIRLLDEWSELLLHSHIVNSADLRQVEENGHIVYLGEHNFTNLDVEVDYVPSVMPVERSEDGRCLCPVSSSDPSDRHVVCSCIAADWKKVRLTRVAQPTVQVTTQPPPKPVQEESQPDSFPYYVAVLIAIFLGIIFVFCVLYKIMKKYKNRGKLVRTRFIADGPSQSQRLIDPRLPTVPCATQWSVLIVYAHDHAMHEAVVLALAEFLRDSFNIKVHLDQWEKDEMCNLHDYINKSVLRADKVLVINSVGSYCRLQGRSRREPLERVRSDHLDHLFEAQIDMALQHARVISCRFSYTPSSATLFSLSPLLQYSIPENLPLLLAAITESSARNDPRLLVGGAGGYDPTLDRIRMCITRMQNYIDSEPNWFERTHRRVPIHTVPIPRYAPTTTVMTPLLPAISDVEEESPIHIEEQAPDSGIAEASRSSIEGLIDMTPIKVEEEQIEEEEEEAGTSESREIPILQGKDQSYGGEDSAFYSGGIPSTSIEDNKAVPIVKEEIPMERMTRLPVERIEENESVDSGKDDGESSEEEVDTRRDKTFKQPRIEDAFRERAKGEDLSNGDSGNISDFHSGLVVENY